MVEGKRGLREWKDRVHIFLCDTREAAFQQALLIGRMEEDCHEEGRRLVEERLAEVGGSIAWAIIRLHSGWTWE